MADVDYDDVDSWSDEQAVLIDEIDRHLQISEDVLFEATGQAWPGACRAVIQPHASLCGCGHHLWNQCPSGELTLWLPYPILGYDDALGHAYYAKLIADEAELEPTPLIRGVDFDGTEYALRPHVDFRIIDPYTLVLYETACRSTNWPAQTLHRAPGTAGTWAIEVVYGGWPPLSVYMAAVRFAGALLKRTCGAQDCPLPQGVSSVTVNNTVMRVGSAQDYLRLAKELDRWMSGIPEIDLSILAYVGPPAARVLPPYEQRWTWNTNDAMNTIWRLTPTPAPAVC